MKHGLILSSALVAVLVASPLAWANTYPDFAHDAAPILKMQHGLLNYVQSRFEVKVTGTAKYPGDDEHRPEPPFIFRARPLGSTGPYTLRLLIQPGPEGHILGVVDISKVHLTKPGGPEVASRPPGEAPAEAPANQPQRDEPFQAQPDQPQPAQAPAPPVVQVPDLSAGPVDQQPLQQPQPQQPVGPGPVQPPASAPAAQPPEPTSDTPSGPITAPSSPASSSGQPNLAPPPDPAPAGQ